MTSRPFIPGTPDNVGRLRAALAILAEVPGVSVNLPADVLLTVLSPEASPEGPSTDLGVAEVAARFGRSKSAVRGWLDRGLLPGAYLLLGKAWRVPRAAVAAFEAAQQGGSPDVHRGRRSQKVDLGAWRAAER